MPDTLAALEAEVSLLDATLARAHASDRSYALLRRIAESVSPETAEALQAAVFEHDRELESLKDARALLEALRATLADARVALAALQVAPPVPPVHTVSAGVVAELEGVASLIAGAVELFVLARDAA